MELKVYDSYGKCGPADTPQELGHACVTTGRRGFSLPSFSEEAQRPPHGKRATWSGIKHTSFYRSIIKKMCPQIVGTFIYLYVMSINSLI